MARFWKLITLLCLSTILSANKIENPENITKVFGTSPPFTYLMYILNPDKMIGVNFRANNKDNNANKKFLKQSFLELPVLGSFHSGQGINIETIIKYNPDLILIWEDDSMPYLEKERIMRTKIPVILAPFRKIKSMPSSIQLVAKAIGEDKRGELLSSYINERIDFLENLVKDVKKVTYYYAEGNDGLSTECSDSFHTEALNFAGGDNVHKCTQSSMSGMEKITFEKLVEYDPDVIVAQNKLIYKEIFSNPLWRHLKAVQNNRVLLVPNTPFNWIDRPPSFMRIMGAEWLASNFYPELYKTDLNEQIKKFYKLFLYVDITDEDIKSILEGIE